MTTLCWWSGALKTVLPFKLFHVCALLPRCSLCQSFVDLCGLFSIWRFVKQNNLVLHCYIYRRRIKCFWKNTALLYVIKRTSFTIKHEHYMCSLFENIVAMLKKGSLKKWTHIKKVINEILAKPMRRLWDITFLLKNHWNLDIFQLNCMICAHSQFSFMIFTAFYTECET